MQIKLKFLGYFVPTVSLLIAACDEKEPETRCDSHVVSDFWIDDTREVVMGRDGERLRFWEKNGDFYVSECEFRESSGNGRSLENESGDKFFEILHEYSDAIYLKNSEEIHIFRPVDCDNVDENLIKVLIAIKGSQSSDRNTDEALRRSEPAPGD